VREAEVMLSQRLEQQSMADPRDVPARLEGSASKLPTATAVFTEDEVEYRAELGHAASSGS
jgi:hypothetical protein